MAHTRLINKLEFYSIRGEILSWIISFLSDRTQQVVVSGIQSLSCSVSSGVPQEPVLGPALFLLYINDITLEIQSQVCLFADDCLIYRTIYSEIDHTILQKNLNYLDSWASKWQMELMFQNARSFRFLNVQEVFFHIV